MKQGIQIACTLSLVILVSAQAVCASCAVAILTKERVVIVSDKRRSSARRGRFVAKQDESKLRRLPNGMILLVSGILRDTRPGGFDIFEVAKGAAQEASNVEDVATEIEDQVRPKLTAVAQFIRTSEPAVYKRSLVAGKPCLDILLLKEDSERGLNAIRKSFVFVQGSGKKILVTPSTERWGDGDSQRLLLFGMTDDIKRMVDADPLLPFRNSIEDNARSFVRLAAKLHPDLVSKSVDVVVVEKGGVTWKR